MSSACGPYLEQRVGATQVAQVLKKRKVKEEGGQNLFVEQNHRPQLLYTENDRPILEAAWEDHSFLCLCSHTPHMPRHPISTRESPDDRCAS